VLKLAYSNAEFQNFTGRNRPEPLLRGLILKGGGIGERMEEGKERGLP